MAARFESPRTSARFANWTINSLVERAALTAFNKGGRSHAVDFINEITARVGDFRSHKLVSAALAAVRAEAGVFGVWDL